MTVDRDKAQADLGEMFDARTEALWSDMPDDLKFVLRRKIHDLGPLAAIREIGRHFKDGAWSITPFPGQPGIGRIGLQVSTELVKRLRDPNG